MHMRVRVRACASKKIVSLPKKIKKNNFYQKNVLDQKFFFNHARARARARGCARVR